MPIIVSLCTKFLAHPSDKMLTFCKIQPSFFIFAFIFARLCFLNFYSKKQGQLRGSKPRKSQPLFILPCQQHLYNMLLCCCIIIFYLKFLLHNLSLAALYAQILTVQCNLHSTGISQIQINFFRSFHTLRLSL